MRSDGGLTPGAQKTRGGAEKIRNLKLFFN